ncbi:3-methyladenine DNA glycosylase [Saccharopolyspora cebuensis]|uniref:3-methyladenine DNA glycosylase n=1 Tax=Saccharopolyspora cebuensis TaxID=418759 RepID=A0ABV4CCV1_9PSEU
MDVLPEAEWRARRDAHLDRVREWTVPYRARRQRDEPHPVLDFMWNYYSVRPSVLERWQPPVGIALAGGDEFLARREFTTTPRGVALAPEALTAKRRTVVRSILRLLAATASRAPRLHCFGLHEWAMVYRSTPLDVRHSAVPLRLGHAGTDAVVESMPIRCTHHDAFRFFTEDARPLNAHQPRRSDQVELEQPGCLHANMDLFKWSFKLAPFVPAELVADCFAFALRIREVDMRASPYDLRAYGYEPIPVEESAGRTDYARRQRAFAEEGAELRGRLLDAGRSVLRWAGEPLDAEPTAAGSARGG